MIDPYLRTEKVEGRSLTAMLLFVLPALWAMIRECHSATWGVQMMLDFTGFEILLIGNWNELKIVKNIDKIIMNNI